MPICLLARRPGLPDLFAHRGLQWVDCKVKQRVLLRPGRLDELRSSGRLDSLIQSLGQFSEKLAVLGAHAHGDSITTRSAGIGPALIFQRLWQACSIDKVPTALVEDRRFEFPSIAPFSLPCCIASRARHRPCRRELGGQLCHRRRRRSGLAPPLPGHSLAGRGSSEGPAGRGHAFRAACQQGLHRGRAGSRDAVTCSPIWTSCSSTPGDQPPGEAHPVVSAA